MLQPRFDPDPKMKRYPGMEQETKEAGDKGEGGMEEGRGGGRQRRKGMEQETMETGGKGGREVGEWKKGGKGGRSNRG